MTIDGYADRLSYAVGDLVSLCCSTTAERLSVEVARVGGSREIVWRDADIAGVSQPVPENAAQVGCGWTPTVQFTIPPSWRSGYYEVILRTRDAATGRDEESLAFFAVRHTEQAHDRGQMLLVLATNTYNAYNDWGGPSLYTGAVRVSFERPMARGFLRKPEPYLRYPNLDDVHDPEHERFRSWADQHGLARWSGSSGWYQWERLFVQWAERAGYTVDVAVNADLEQRPEIVDDYPLLVSVGHDEYWSWGMRDTAEAFIGRGGNYAFLSGNSVCWQVRYEDDGRTMVGYKADPEADPLYGTDEQHLVSTLWCSQLVNRPENQLTGSQLQSRRIHPHGSGRSPRVRGTDRMASRPLGLRRMRSALRRSIWRRGLDRGLRGGRLRVHALGRGRSTRADRARWHSAGLHHLGDGSGAAVDP